MTTTIEKIYASGSGYNIASLSWTPDITTIDSMGAYQIVIYVKKSASESSAEWTQLERSSWISTYDSTSKTVDLSNATYVSGSSSVPAAITNTADSVRFLRVTSLTPFKSFTAGAKLSASDLTTVHDQLFHAVQEEDANTSVDIAAERTYLTTNYYTKTEVDTFFSNLNLFPDWTVGASYLVGDVVLYSGKIWYATIDHTAVTGDPPEVGDSKWTTVAPDATVENITYIRKFPGIKSTPPLWNTIVPQQATAKGLVLQYNPDLTATADLFQIQDSSQNVKVRYSTTNKMIFDTQVDFNTTPEFNDDVKMFQSTTGKSLFVGVAPTSASQPNVLVGTYPRVVISRSDGDNAYLECRKDDGTTHFLVGQSGLVTTFSGFYSKDDARFFENIWGGTAVYTSLPTLTDSGVRSVGLTAGDKHLYGDLNIRLGHWSGSAFTEKLTIDGSTGSIGTESTINAAGTITSDSMVQADKVRLTQAGMQSASYLGTNSSGDIITKTGPAYSNSVNYDVTNNDGNALANADPVYLGRSETDVVNWALAQSNDVDKASVGVISSVVSYTESVDATGRIDAVSPTASAYLTKTCQICDGSDGSKKCVTFTAAGSAGGSGTAWNWNLGSITGNATYVDALDLDGTASSSTARITITVPTAAGGAGSAIIIQLCNDTTGNTSAGSGVIGVGTSGASDGTVAEAVVDAFNGVDSHGRVNFGSGTSASGIAGLTATLSGSEKVTLTASNTGTDGNSITVADVAGAIVGDGSGSQTVTLAGGYVPEAKIAERIKDGIQAAVTAGDLRVSVAWSSGNEFVTLANTRADGTTTRSIGDTGNVDMVLTGSDSAIFTTTGMSGGADKCGDNDGTGGTFPCQDFTVTFQGAVSGFTGKVCNCANEHGTCGETGTEAECDEAGEFTSNLKPGDWYYVSEIGKLRNWKWHTLASSKINDPIGLALTSDILMVMPYRANKT